MLCAKPKVDDMVDNWNIAYRENWTDM